ncbi:MAG: hypothetical protein ACI9XC_001643 [Gammaproteobacteria bacterium]|jgi:hypothetical protein
MNKFFLGLAVSVFIVALFYAFYLRQPKQVTPVSFEISPPTQVKQVIEEAPPPIQYPVPEVIAEFEPVKPLPILDESDLAVEEEFKEVITEPSLSELLLFKTFIRNFVVIVDNLTARMLPQKYYFFRPPGGTFMVTLSEDDSIYLDSDNFQRYIPFINLINSLDLDRLTQIYTYLYPLFQEAYIELGYPDRYFNDRLIEVIDTLLDTKDVSGPVKLIQPTVYYKYADPELEALNAGQKLLIRIGPENTSLIKVRLMDLKVRLMSLNGYRQ